MPANTKTALTARKSASGENVPEIAVIAKNGASRASESDICFPATADAYTGAAAIGISGIYAGRRLTLGKRVVTGSWLRADGTRGSHHSRWIEYERVVCGVAMHGMALVPESAYMCVALVARTEKAA